MKTINDVLLLPIEYIVWEDPTSGTNEWTPLKEIREMSLTKIHTVGWVVKEDITNMTVLPHVSNDLDGFGEIVIPKELVKLRKVLHKGVGTIHAASN